jgi:hypothetical protein
MNAGRSILVLIKVADKLLQDRFRTGSFLLLVWLISVGLFTDGCASLLGKNKENRVDPVPGQAILKWNADPNLKFNIYRRTENGNDIQINQDPIKPLKEFSGGKGLTAFEYIDRTVRVGEGYYYTLEQIDRNGKTSTWDTPWKISAVPLEVEPPKE